MVSCSYIITFLFPNFRVKKKMLPEATNLKITFRIFFKITYLYSISKPQTIKRYTPADRNGFKQTAFNMLRVNNTWRHCTTNKIDYRPALQTEFLQT